MAKAVLREISAEGDVRRLERLRGRWLSDYVSDISYAEKKSRQEGRQEERQAVILNMLLWMTALSSRKFRVRDFFYERHGFQPHIRVLVNALS